MRALAELYSALDASTRSRDKMHALVHYFRTAEPKDAAWTVAFFIGKRPRQTVSSALLRTWAAERAGLPTWLFDESYDAVGDLAETIALVLPPASTSDDTPLSVWIEERLLPLRSLPIEDQRERIRHYWDILSPAERFVFNKLLTGGFRVGAAHGLVQRALAEVANVPPAVIAQRLMGSWAASGEAFAALVSPTMDAQVRTGQPYPFMLASSPDAWVHAPTDQQPQRLQTVLGDIQGWIAEWKWDGIRAQLIRRAGQVYLWSRGEEDLRPQFPELLAAAKRLPDVVLDGEILVSVRGQVQPFAQLQARLNRKVTSAALMDAVPVMMLVYDLLEHDGEDCRSLPLVERRQRLADIVYSIPWAANETLRFDVSSRVRAPSWETLAQARQAARALGAEGLMLKRALSAYQGGRLGGDWCKWKLDPYTIDAVLIYAQRGHGKRASLYTDYTFGLWQDTPEGRRLVPFAKAYSGLTDAEIRAVDAFIRKNTVEQFGPVRTVRPHLVFEIGFEGIQRSARHKSGIAVRFPRMLRWRQDKAIDAANSVADALALIAPTVFADMPRRTRKTP
jgi:DNA ligase 1